MYPNILGIGAANPPIRLTQEQTFYAAGYKEERIRQILRVRGLPTNLGILRRLASAAT